MRRPKEAIASDKGIQKHSHRPDAKIIILRPKFDEATEKLRQILPEQQFDQYLRQRLIANEAKAQQEMIAARTSPVAMAHQSATFYDTTMVVSAVTFGGGGKNCGARHVTLSPQSLKP